MLDIFPLTLANSMIYPFYCTIGLPCSIEKNCLRCILIILLCLKQKEIYISDMIFSKDYKTLQVYIIYLQRNAKEFDCKNDYDLRRF